jgi:uncharacterized membrane protein
MNTTTNTDDASNTNNNDNINTNKTTNTNVVIILILILPIIIIITHVAWPLRARGSNEVQSRYMYTPQPTELPLSTLCEIKGWRGTNSNGFLIVISRHTSLG